MSWEQALNCPEADGPVEGDTHISTRIFLLGLGQSLWGTTIYPE